MEPAKSKFEQLLAETKRAIANFKESIRTTDYVDPNEDYELYVNGHQGGYIDFGVSPNFSRFGSEGQQTFTIELWMKVKSQEGFGSVISTFVEKGDDNDPNHYRKGWCVNLFDQKSLRMTYASDNWNLMEPGLEFNTLNEWVHFTACGEEEVIVENTNEEVTQEVQTQEVQTQEVAEAPTETVAETGTEAEGGPLLQVAVMEIPDLSGTEWNFAGGMIDGVEMEEEDLNATLETYGGTLQLVFGEDGAVTMVQGGGNAEGTYEYSDDNTAIKMTLDFGGTEVTYAGFLSEVGDTVTLIAMSDMNGYDGLYFVQ